MKLECMLRTCLQLGLEINPRKTQMPSQFVFFAKLLFEILHRVLLFSWFNVSYDLRKQAICLAEKKPEKFLLLTANARKAKTRSIRLKKSERIAGFVNSLD